MSMRCQWVRDVCPIVLHSKTLAVYSTTKPTKKFHVLFFVILSKVLTLITNVQIKHRFCQITGHTVRLGGRGMVYYLNAGQELNEQREYRDLLSAPFLS